MEQAANDFDVELRLVTLTETNSVSEQRMLLSREAKGGADALILAPADPDALGDAVAEAGIPVVTMQAPVGNAPCISVDNEAMGGELARSMLPRLRTRRPGRAALGLSRRGRCRRTGRRREAGARGTGRGGGGAVASRWPERDGGGPFRASLRSPRAGHRTGTGRARGSVRVFQGLESAPPSAESARPA